MKKEGQPSQSSTVINMSNNPFDKIIQLEEISHRPRPIKSILASAHKPNRPSSSYSAVPASGKKQVSYSPDLNLNKTPDLVPADERVFQQHSDDESPKR